MEAVEQVPVHPWTRRWWEMLPETYRVLDAQTALPRRGTWLGINSSPRFARGWDGWSTEALYQRTDAVAVRLSQAFTGATSTQPIWVQIWADVTSGTSITVRAASTTGQTLGAVTSTAGEDVETALSFMPPVDGRFTVMIDMHLPVTAPDGSLSVHAVAVSTARLTYADIPEDNTGKAYPLLRWMDGIGRVAGQIHDAVEAAWDGRSFTPETAPAHLLPWLAQMTGIPVAFRQGLSGEQLRSAIIATRDAGRPPAGSRGAIAEMARTYLTGGRGVVVLPSNVPHELLILVRADEVPGGDIDAFAAFMVASGVVPAGHTLRARTADPSWAHWEAVAGATWAEKEARIRTWLDSDSAGVTL